MQQFTQTSAAVRPVVSTSVRPTVQTPNYARAGQTVAAPTQAEWYAPAEQTVEGQYAVQSNGLATMAFPAMLMAAVAVAAWVYKQSAKVVQNVGPQDLYEQTPLAMAAYTGRVNSAVGPLKATEGGAEGTQKYAFVVANSRFMLYEEEHAMEILREKRRFMKEKGQEVDFWLVPNPEFLDGFPKIDAKVRKPCCALVSTDTKWITFMKLRLDKVLIGEFEASTDISEALKTKGGDPQAAIPKFDLPEYWEKTVPYPKYADDWYQTFLVPQK